MKFKSTKFKLRKLFNKTNRNEDERNRKENNLTVPKSPSNTIKPPKVLFESEWLSVPTRTDTGSSTLETNETTFIDAFGGLAFGATKTAQKGQLAPLQVQIDFRQILSAFPKRLLSYVKLAVVFKGQEDVKPTPIIDDYSPYTYEEEPYIIVKGRKGASITKIYDALGDPSGDSKYNDVELLDMGVLSSGLISTVWQADIALEAGGNWFNREIDFIQTAYNYATITASDSSTREDFDSFNCPAIDTLTSSTVNGTGTFTTNRWTWDDSGGPVVWTFTQTVTKNVTTIGTLFVRTGSTIINGTLASSMSDIRITQENGANLRYLWYSIKRANRFDLTSIYNLDNIPTKDDYETDDLPYDEITVEVNNGDDYPAKIDPEDPSTVFFSSNAEPLWVNADPTQEPSLRHMIMARKTVMFYAPSNDPEEVSFDFVDESWIPNGLGSTFEKDEENRDDKIKELYTPTDRPVEAKIVLTLNTPNHYYKVDKSDVQETE